MLLATIHINLLGAPLVFYMIGFQSSSEGSYQIESLGQLLKCLQVLHTFLETCEAQMCLLQLCIEF